MCLAVAAAACYLALPAFAIDPNRAMSQYVRDRWSTESGFPKGAVYDIAQTTDGYLWFGTERGLVRFDGRSFHLIRDADPRLSTGHVLGLIGDRDGALWVRLRRPTLLRYKGGRFENVMAELGRPASTVTAMGRMRDGSLLVWVLEGEGTAIRYAGNRFETLVTTTGLSRSPVMSVAETTPGTLWIGTRDAGLFRLRPGGGDPITDGLPDPKINCLLSTQDGQLWVGTDNGIALWNGHKLTQPKLPVLPAPVRALALTRDRDSNIWVGTNSQGLMRLNAEGVAFLDDASRRSYEAVTAVFEDREGNLWIGSASGVERLRDSVFVTYGEPEGLPSEDNGAVYAESRERAWFAPVDGGLYSLINGKTAAVHAGGLDRDVIYSIAGGPGVLWAGRQRGGLTELRLGDGVTTAKTYTQADGLAQNSVYSVYRNRDGSVWAGTLSGGASHLEHGRFTNYTLSNGLASNTVVSILEGADGTMWFATPQGLSSLSNGKWRTFTTKEGLPSDSVNCLAEDAKGVLWIGTSAGLACLRGGRIQNPRGKYAPLHEQILGLAFDHGGSLWLSTAGHVLRLDAAAVLNGGVAAESVREYTRADGLHGTEGVKRHRSVVADPEGRIWFSLNRGLSVVDPGRLSISSAPAIAHIQSIQADGELVDLGKAVHIAAGRRRIVFDFVGLSLAVPERVQFRYALDGFDHGWSAPVAEHQAVYTNLGPGPYRFRVIASNVDGAWNGEEATLQFQIEPAYWQTWWFRLGCAVALILAVVALYRLRLLQLTRQLNIRFEERLAERTRIAQDLHDTLLQGFLSASMQLHVAADTLPDESAAKPRLERILKLMGQVIDEGRHAVQGLRSSRSDSHDLDQAFSRIQQEMGIQEDVNFRVIVQGHPRAMHPILRDEVYRIGREAVVNAFRHAQAKSIEVELEYTSKQFRFLVRDDGCGIDPHVLRQGKEGHWGLPGMRERAEWIGAKLHVYSSTSAGTEVELSVPNNIAFAGKHSRLDKSAAKGEG
ncbi:two-component regulator propeller domain-containing protein [uncultured Paludibaculum sp.]|uniref:sensor histidine kinase n=1 Tax=uncultured Paludibaculum sp. TaxID=1765020 RepID=UPI002AAB6BCA|nr:two-component regulator propeller domain-containing protein [uncultured Paludibaculum sp.]